LIGDRDAEDLLESVALVVVGAGEGGSHAKAVGLGAPHVIAGQLEPLDVHGVLLGALADLLGRHFGPVGKQVPEPLAFAHQVKQFDHGLVIAEAQLESARVLQCKDSPLEQFHGKGDGDARRDGVEPELVTDAVGSDDGVGIINACATAEGVERLVFGTLGEETGIGTMLGQAHLAAPHGAAGASGLARAQGFYGIAADLVGRVEDAGARPVFCWVDAERLGEI